MLPGLYSAATALSAGEQNHEIIARNLAHVDVPGYRRRVVAFEPFAAALLESGPTNLAAAGVGTHLDVIQTDFTPGPIVRTGRTLDVAIAGDGFLAVEGPDGPLYTRNGRLHVGQEGQLVTGDGRPVLGEGGPLALPEQATPSQVVITSDGTVQVSGATLGKLRVVSFDDNQQLVPVGKTLFQAPAELVSQPSTAPVRQGMRESSNVAAVDELIQMVVGMRHYEASQKALTSIAEAVAKNTNPRSG